MTYIKYFICVFFTFGLIQTTYGEGQCSIKEQFLVNPKISSDPNEILGTSGYGEENYIAQRDYLNYTIYFENDAEKATAPAQEILVKDTLDLTKFNPDDFSFGTFTFRDITIAATPGVTEFSHDEDMRPKGEDIIVRIQGTFNKTTGEVRCYMIALDPVTMDLIENPNLGILYPNTAPPVGEGNFTYRIGLKTNLPNETVIENQASITFDLNEPITTNVFVNTLDLSKPESNINGGIDSEDNSKINLSWSGVDGGSGIANYTVYVSVNDEDFYVWKSNTSETSGTFEGTLESTYKFYVQATDNVGNMEEEKSATALAISLFDTHVDKTESNPYGLTVVPNPVRKTGTIQFNLEQSEAVKLILLNATRQEIKMFDYVESKIGINKVTFDASNLSAGIYFVQMQGESRKKAVARVVIK